MRVVRSDFAMSELQNLSISQEAEETITTKSGANHAANGMAPTTSMYELTGITFELRKGGRELFFLSLDTTPTGAENLRGGLHAAAPVTGNDSVAAAPSLALRQFSNSSGVTKIKENLGEAICIRGSIIFLPWFLEISWLELEPA